MKLVPKSTTPINALHADVRRLLKKYKCEYELHEVRALLMGAIASPMDQVNPMQELISLWNGQLPSLKNTDTVNELMQVFAMGLWNQLSAHSDPGHPFELTAPNAIESNKDLKLYSKIKNDEIECFITGFFQGQDKIKLPPEIGESLDVLEDLSGMFAGTIAMPAKAGAADMPISNFAEKLRQLAKIAQREINIIVVSAAQARRQGGSPSRTLH
jgi:hypothetical protein